MMPSNVEAQSSLPEGLQRAHSLGMRGCDPELIYRLEGAWGGPLPGRVTGIQESPLRCELRGPAPGHLLRALDFDWRDPLLCGFWSLRPSVRHAGVYHRDLVRVPLPALPTGTRISTGSCAVRVMLDYDRPGSPLSYRLYVFVDGGTAERTWPGLVPPRADPAADISYYGLNYGPPDLAVRSIERYDVRTAMQAPALQREYRRCRQPAGQS